MMENGGEPAELLKDILIQPAGKTQATLPGEKAGAKPELSAEAAKELSGQPVHVTRTIETFGSSLHNTGQGTGETGNAAIMATNTEAAVKFADALPADTAKAPVNSLARWTEDILGRIGEKTRIILGSGQSEIQIQLKPDFLGKVNLQVTMENGQMTARIGVENQQVKELVEANLKQLQQNLDNQGFKVSNLVVDLSANRQFHHFNRHHDYGSGQTVRLRNTGYSEGYDSPAVNDGVAAAGWKSMDSTVEYIA
ncbi:hypothetical protein FDZ73_23455 [bacterium]|nr:MAG: hypothetical protein FDZ73_23455 [bacterium]